MAQSIESKNTNILSRFDTKESDKPMTAFRVSVGGDNMTYLSKLCKTKQDVLDYFSRVYPSQEVIFLE